MSRLLGTFVRRAVFVALAWCVPLAAGAQGVAGGNIAGIVRDASGAVLPGVTVEAASPALIEKARSVVTDGDGRYLVVDLRPGTYAVTFTLSGFKTLRRDGIELTTGFTATVNANLEVGALEETVTVTGEAPLVDTRSTIQQQVLSGELVRSLPVGKNVGLYSTTLPAAISAPANQDVGGVRSEVFGIFSVHGSSAVDMMTLRDGMLDSTMLGFIGANVSSSVNPVTIQETTVQLSGGLSAEAVTGGAHINVVPRDGGNRINVSFLTDFSNSGLQSENVDDALRARGVNAGTEIRELYDIAGGIGGPVVRDRLWYFGSSRYWTSSTWAANNYANVAALKGTLFYQPDLATRAYEGSFYGEGGVRLTLQATPKHKFTYSTNLERTCSCQFLAGTGTRAPEAAGDMLNWPYHRHQVSWQSPLTSRLLAQAGFLYTGGTFDRRLQGGDAITVFDLTRFFIYGNGGENLLLGRTFQRFSQSNVNGSVSYVTGTHALKIGGLLLRAPKDFEVSIPQDVMYTFAGSAPGVAAPVAVTYFATPFGYRVRLRQMGLYVQDRWTIDRLTLDLGLRYDHVNAHVPAASLAAGPWVGAREFPEVKDVPNWRDINPRVGAVYDLFGDGRTAIKVSLGRFISHEPTDGVPQENNPTSLMVTQATRFWQDANRDYVPQESELSPYSDANFGKVVPGTVWDRAVLEGWQVRPYSWQGSVSLQHELLRQVSLNVGYFRTWYGNFRVSDNRAVGPSDFDEFCITAPAGNLPNAGQQICGLFDVKPALFGHTDFFVTKASAFGKQTEVYNGVDVTANARLFGGGMVTGGVSVGRTVTDKCDLQETLPEIFAGLPGRFGPEPLDPFCRKEPSWGSKTAFKVSANLPLPWDLQASANYQNNPGVSTGALYVVASPQVAPSLGRPLASGPFGFANVRILEPDTLYREGRINQFNFALARSFRVGGARLQPRVELHNAFNANPILALNNQIGPAFDTVQSILAPRMVKFGVRFDF